ncbi:hypothetical protein MCEMKE45_01350 [Candidatus Planktophila vernalis]|uniref:hypothetical protein n=1 Tax=Candidatus Planktophila vernalis TaxID=1884907 RepID=UPI003CFB68DC
MSKLTNLPLRAVVTDLILSVTTFLLLFSFRKFDFDGGHEGYLLTTAIAQADGYQIYKEYFSLYGSILPWTQSLVISVSRFGSAINLRILDSLIIALIFFLILNLRRFISPKKQGVHRILILSAITWILLAYFFNGMSQHPWSSTIALAMQLVIVNLLFWMLTLQQSKRIMYLPIFVIGGLLSILPFTRLNVGIATLISTYLILFTFSKSNRSYHFARARILAVNIIGIALFILHFVLNGLISVLFEQSILIPRRVFTSSWMVGPENWNAIPVITRYFFMSLPLVVIVILLVYILNRKIHLIATNMAKYVSVISAILLGIFMAVFLHVAQRGFWLYQRLIVFVMVFGITISVLLIVRHMMKIFTKVNTSNEIAHVQLVVLAFFGLSGIVQIYPTHDPRHIWWGLPLLILLVPLALDLPKSLPKISLGTTAYATTILVLAGAVFALGAQESLSSRRVSIDFDSPFKGMEVTPEKYIKLKSEFLFLKEHLEPNSSVYFQCGVDETHWLATFDGRYHSKSPWFVDLSFYPGHPKPQYPTKVGDQLIICGDSNRQSKVALELGFAMIAKSKYLAIAELKVKS